MTRILPLVLILVLASCGWPHRADRASAQDDIREAVFRYQLEVWQGHRVRAYYLDFGDNGTDPPDDFIRRFVGHSPPVKKVSQCKVRNLREGVIDSETGEHGLIFSVTSIKWISDKKVEVAGGYYQNGLSASGNTYTVRWRKGKWKVTRDRLHWMS